MKTGNLIEIADEIHQVLCKLMHLLSSIRDYLLSLRFENID